jgi:hypothetical protein
VRALRCGRRLLALALLSAGCSGPPAGSARSAGVTPRPQVTAALPDHRVNDTWTEGVSTWVFLVVDRSLSEDAARQLVNYYRSQYPAARIFNIDMFCDARYASRASVDTGSISDDVFYSHILYSYMTGPSQTVFYTPSNHPGQATACHTLGKQLKKRGDRR